MQESDSANMLWTRALVEQNRQWLFAYILSMTGNPKDTEDLVQQVFLVALKNQAKYDAERPLGAWLRGIARNLVREYEREVAKSPVIANSEALEYLDKAAAARASSWAHPEYKGNRLAALKKCLRGLTNRVRVMLEFKYRDNLRSQTIAERLGMRNTAVDMALSRARKFLMKCIELKMRSFQYD